MNTRSRAMRWTTAPKPAMQISATLNVDDRNVLATSTDAKSHAANSVYQWIGVLVVNLAANAADIHIDDVGRRVKIEIPHVLQQHCPRHDLALVADQIFQDLEFSRQ